MDRTDFYDEGTVTLAQRLDKCLITMGTTHKYKRIVSSSDNNKTVLTLRIALVCRQYALHIIPLASTSALPLDKTCWQFQLTV
jgi:hypothetical protein